MTLKMLPPAPKDVGRLSDVFQSAFGSIVGGNQNPLGLRRVDSAVVVVIDGLGSQQLSDYAGHARNLSKWFLASAARSIRCGFPSTTAVSLTSLGTGLRAGAHGVLGYQVLDSEGNPKNMLNGWSSPAEAVSWRFGDTIASKAGVNVYMVAHSEYQGSAFTELIMQGAQFSGRDELGSRVRRAVECAGKPKSLVYLYFAELDQAGHRFGVGSSQWISALEGIDSALANLSGKFGVVVTSDHGMVNVDASNHLYLDAVPGFPEAVSHAIGDPRALLCYGDFAAAKLALTAVAAPVYVVSWQELEQRGWVKGSASAGRIPDFCLMPQGNIALYDRRTAKPQSLKMVGQHGGISDAETQVPLILAGLFV